MRFLKSALVLASLWGCSSAVLAASTITRSTAFDYNPATGQLIKEVVEPANPALCVVKEYTNDDYGHQTQVKTRNCNGSAGQYPGTLAEAAAPSGDAVFTSRTDQVTYTADRRFAETVTNAANQTEKRTYDSRLGVVTSITDPNNLTTGFAYDNFGRKILEKRADGNGTKWEYVYCIGTAGGNATCPTINGAVGAYVITTTPVAEPIDLIAKTAGSANGPYAKVYYDGLGRAIRSETVGFNGSLVYQDTKYDNLGNVASQSRPYFANATPVWTNFSYDIIGRVETQTWVADTGSVALSTTTYHGLTTTVTDPLRHQTTQVKNEGGQVSTITNHLGETLTQVYDANSNLVQSIDAQGNVTSLEYDAKGRKTKMYDPDLGVWSYTYNALGELISQRDAKGQVKTLQYDVLGRLVTSTEASLISSWYYDRDANNLTCGPSIGKLCEVKSGNGYGRKHLYDPSGRPQSTTTSLVGAISTSSFTSSVTYSGDGRVASQTYPTGLTVKNQYQTSNAFALTQVIDTRTNLPLWTANQVDAAGRVTQFTSGNGVVNNRSFSDSTGAVLYVKTGANNAVQNTLYTYNEGGLLKTANDVISSVSTDYAYDEVNRLLTESRSGAQPEAQVWTYDKIGNISTHTVKASLASSNGVTDTYNYNPSGSSMRPHAVANVSGFVGGYGIPIYTYDDNGNLLSGAGRTVSWFSFNKVASVSNAAGNQLNYLYDAEFERVQEKFLKAGVEQRTTVYLNPGAGAGLYYEDESGLTGTKKKHYISAGGGTVAMIVCTATPCTSIGNTSTQYWHTDRLGSVAAVTNDKGAVVERMAYEPFGRRRNVNGLTDTSGALAGVSTDRGFTGHEHMDEVGLINMNGRIFDPGLGRFMSADPVIQSPDNLQSYNRYSYVWNCPTCGTDPSGYSWLSDTWHKVWRSEVGRFAISMAVAYYTGNLTSSWLTGSTDAALTMSQSMIVGAAGGFSGAFVGSGGNLEAGLKGGITGAGMGWAGSFTGSPVAHYAAHAAVGCLSAEMNGGNCGKGAIAQMVSLAITHAVIPEAKGFDLQQFAATTLAGGVSSRILGGSFENGAKTAAYGYLFNQLQKHQRYNQAARLQRVGSVVSGFIEGMRDVCPDCSQYSFNSMSLEASPLTAEQAGFPRGVLAFYRAKDNTAVFYQEFFEKNVVSQANAVFHEYAHSLPGNQKLFNSATTEQWELPHDDRPWEQPVILLEKLFQDRFGDKIWKALK